MSTTKPKPDQDPRVYGHIPGAPVGSTFATRHALWKAGVHGMSQAGIHGSNKRPAYSIVMSGRYKDDFDEGERFVYSGEGGTGDNKNGKRNFLGDQCADQSWTRGNKSLQLSYESKVPVRVVRGHTLGSRYAPVEGYRYDGLYQVTQATYGDGKTAFKTCKFTFDRLPGQPSLPNEILISRKSRIAPRKSRIAALEAGARRMVQLLASTSTPVAGSSRDGVKSEEIDELEETPQPVPVSLKRKWEDRDRYQPEWAAPGRVVVSDPARAVAPPKSEPPVSTLVPTSTSSLSLKPTQLPQWFANAERAAPRRVVVPHPARAVAPLKSEPPVSAPIPTLNTYLPPKPTQPPHWLVNAMRSMRSVYRDDIFGYTCRANGFEWEWFIRCSDCPENLYTTGDDKTLHTYEIHLNDRSHRERVNARLKRVL
ncbi:PUA-like domain-containing protein [Mycena leptocephala]|nr:PUA-like domain-containing protein [Mycena leptocephala]